MRYLTKQWYQTMQNTSFHCLQKIDSRAGVYSESFFREAYEEAESAWLRSRRKVCRLLKVPLDEEAERKQFQELYLSQKEHYESRLPEHILNRIPDVRVLGLGFCTEQTKELLKALSLENERYVNRMMEACSAAERESFVNADASLLECFDFHDEIVISFQLFDRDWVIDFGPCAEGYSQIRYLRFKNAVIQRLDGDLSGAYWLYNELYKTETGYELHILLDREGLLECVLTCDDILLEGEMR